MAPAVPMAAVLYLVHPIAGRNTRQMTTAIGSCSALHSMSGGASAALRPVPTLIVVRRRYPEVRVRLADFEWAVVRRIGSFSLYVLLLNAGARLSFETDALVIGAMLSVGAISFYAIANSVIVYLMEFVTAIAAV